MWHFFDKRGAVDTRGNESHFIWSLQSVRRAPATVVRSVLIGRRGRPSERASKVPATGVRTRRDLSVVFRAPYST
jgi:hypothetical protein